LSVTDWPTWTLPKFASVGEVVVPPVTAEPVIASAVLPAARIRPLPVTLAWLSKLLPTPKFALL